MPRRRLLWARGGPVEQQKLPTAVQCKCIRADPWRSLQPLSSQPAGLCGKSRGLLLLHPHPWPGCRPQGKWPRKNRVNYLGKESAADKTFSTWDPLIHWSTMLADVWCVHLKNFCIYSVSILFTDHSLILVGPEGEGTSGGWWCGADSSVLPLGLLSVHSHKSRTCVCLGY